MIEQLNKDYFALPKVSNYVKTVYLPTTGYDYNRDGSGSGSGRGLYGNYWSASRYGGTIVYRMYFDSMVANVSNSGDTYRFAVRPFQNL